MTIELTQVPKRIKLSWGIGALAVSVLMNAVSFLILYYMVGVLNIEPALAGALVFFTKILDVVSDPIIGVWSDRIKTRIGRRRPFLVPGALISAIAFAMIFTTPLFEQQVFVVIYIFVALLIYTVGYTLFNVPYMAMPAEMTDSFHERSSIHAYRVVFVTGGSFLAGAGAPFMLEQMGRSEWSSYAVIGLSGSAIILIAMLITYFGTAKARHTESGAAVSSIRNEFSAIIKNPFFLRLIAVKACQLLGVSASGAAMLFFIVNSLQLDLTVMSYYFAALTVASIISAPIIVKVSRKIGKRNAYIVIGAVYVINAISWVYAQPDEALVWILVRGLLTGIAMSGNILLAMSMLTDTIDYDTRRTGVRREGAYTAMYSFTEKVTFAFGPLLIGLAMSFAGFDNNLAVEELQPAGVRNALLLGVSYIPAVMGILAILLLIGYRLDEKVLSDTTQSSDPARSAVTA
ncbi:MAG: MFS transporter [Acidiferrobacterales bacterium]|nr:MFS transporter [Acidiferrobacterales bacterium]